MISNLVKPIISTYLDLRTKENKFEIEPVPSKNRLLL